MMRIIKKLIFIGLIALMISSSIVLVNNNDVKAASLSGPLPPDPDTVWTITGTYDITSDISVPLGKTLNLGPGAVFVFPAGQNYKFTIYGTLNCKGTGEEPVVFKSNRVGSKLASDWQGIRIDNGVAFFNHTIIESASTAIKVIKSEPKALNTMIDTCDIGIDAENNAWPRLYNVTVQDCISRDIKVTNSKLNFTASRLKQTTVGSNNAAIELSSTAKFKSTNSTIDDKYKYAIELSGMSLACFLQTSFNYSKTKIRLIDSLSAVEVKNFVHIFVGTKAKVNNQLVVQPIVNASVTVLDDLNAVHVRKTNAAGYVNWREVTHLEYSQAHTNNLHDNITDIAINYGNIFEPSLKNFSMAETHTEYFINDIPHLNFAAKYSIPEDTRNTALVDLWSAIDDDYDPDNKLILNVVDNTGENLNGKAIAGVRVIDNRYLEVDVFSGIDNDNWTGTFAIKLNATDQLGLILGLANESGYIPIEVLGVNDPPVWYDTETIHLNEDTDFINAYDLREHIIDCDDNITDNITFSVGVYDQTQFLITIAESYLNVMVNKENYTGSTDVEVSAFDGEDYGNVTLRIEIDSLQDAPDINKSLIPFKMAEDSIDTAHIDLGQTFFDSDGDVLTYAVSGNTKLGVEIQQSTGKVTIQPEPNWFGREILTFFASDGHTEINDTITVTVEDVNDPPSKPVITHPSASEEKLYKVGEPILFAAHAYDEDIEHPDLDPALILDILSYTWTVNTSSAVLGVSDNFTYALLPEGYHRVTVTVTDAGKKTASAYIDIQIFGQYAPPNVTHLSPLPDYWTNIPNIRLEWSVAALPESIPYVRYDVFMDKLDGTTIIAEKIKMTSYTVTGLEDRTKYYWTIVPYMLNEPGIDLSGTWFFTYDSSVEQIYDLSLTITPLNGTIIPGQEVTFQITVKNLGNMPDRFEFEVDVDKLIEKYVTISKTELSGLDDGIYGLTANEKEDAELKISIPKNFKYSDTYKITITAKSLSKDREKSENINLRILEDGDGSPSEDIAGGNSSLVVLLLFVIVITIVVLMIVFMIYYRRRVDRESESESESITRGMEAGPVPGEGYAYKPHGTGPAPDLAHAPLPPTPRIRSVPAPAGPVAGALSPSPVNGELNLVLALKAEALMRENPSDFDISDGELLARFKGKYEKGEISQKTYDSIQTTLIEE